jgi:GntR family transcriptional regulator/MocR family aminotransferase
LPAIAGATAKPAQVVASGLTVLLKLPCGTSDMVVAREASAFGLAPTPISTWYVSPEDAEAGLLLGVATTPTRNLAQSCDRLFDVIHRCAGLNPGG